MTNDLMVLIRCVVSVVASAVALCSLAAVWRKDPCKEIVAVIIIVWTLGPPVWFFLEQVLVDQIAVDKPTMKELEAGQELASKFWASVAAALFAIHQLYKSEQKTTQ